MTYLFLFGFEQPNNNVKAYIPS